MIEVCALIHLLKVVCLDISECTADDRLLTANEGNFVSMQQLLSNNCGETPQDVSLAVDNDSRHSSFTGKQICSKFNLKLLGFIKIFNSNPKQVSNKMMHLLQPQTEGIFAHLGLLYTPSFESVALDRRQEVPRRQGRDLNSAENEEAIKVEKLQKLLTKQVIDIAEMQSHSRLEEKDAINRAKRRQEVNSKKAALIKERFKNVNQIPTSNSHNRTQTALNADLSQQHSATTSNNAHMEFKDAQTIDELEVRIRDKLKVMIMRWFSAKLAPPETTHAELLAEIFAPTMASHIHEQNKKYMMINNTMDVSEFRFGSSEYIEELRRQLTRLFDGKRPLGPDYRSKKIIQFSKATLQQLKLAPAGHEWE